LENIAGYLNLVLQIIGIASVIANVTPNESDNKIIKIINNVLNIFAANYNVKGLGNRDNKDNDDN